MPQRYWYTGRLCGSLIYDFDEEINVQEWKEFSDFAKNKEGSPVHVTHENCGMSTYDPLQAIYLVKGEKQ